MALSKAQVDQIESIDVNTFSEEYKEELRDIFAVISYFLSQLEVDYNTMLYTSRNRGEA